MRNIGYAILRILLDIESWHFRVDKINQEKSSQQVYFGNILHYIITRHMNRGYYF